MASASRFASLMAVLAVAVALPIACGFPEYGGFGETTSATTGAGGATASTVSSAGVGGGTGGQGVGGGGGSTGSCTSNTECAATPATPVCDTTAHTCVACLPTNDTCPQGSYCTSAEKCAPGCKSDADCNTVGGTGGLTCDKTNHVCLGCASDDQCPLGLLCDLATSSCVPGCTAAHGCPATEACCSGQCADLATDAAHCGSCTTPCAPAHGTGTCSAGACKVASCDSGFNDCDGVASNGCESDASTDPNHCGGCATKCAAPANASAACQNGTCTLGACNPNYGDCDGNPANGCEVNLLTSASNCSGCGLPCSSNHGTPACSNGTCSITCDVGYKNCDNDPSNGCEVNIATNVNNCGACNFVCQPQGGTPACVNGLCTVSSCSAGKGDCDGNPSNGCETNTTTDPNNCGGCGLACFVANGVAGCGASACYVAGCNPGFADCDKLYATGCEVNVLTSVTDCGGCGLACTNAHGTTTCQSGVCAPVCASGYQDCDSNPANGCETNLNSDPANCGACGKACSFANGAGTCQAGTCVLTSCSPGYADCDLNPTNGCETPLNTTSNCGKCGLTCTNSNGTTACAGGVCTPSCTSGFGDCDGNPNNGCETNTSTSVSNCGGCGKACSSANGTPSCSGGQCSISCNAPYQNCNGDARTDGCETNTNNNPSHCGSCTTVCSGSTPNCVGGMCSATTCPSGTSDCDGSSGNGCECQTPTCCGTSCATKHDDGVGQNYYDCVAVGTYNQTQALKACTAFTGDSSLCDAFGCTGPGSNAVVCSDKYGVCACWDYTGTSAGKVYDSNSTTCNCPGSAGVPWN